MNCERIRDIIITDYIDHELDEKKQKEIEDHLSNCANCRAFEKALITAVVEPLRNSPAVNLPETLWSKIRNSLEQEEENGYVTLAEGGLFACRVKWLNAALVISILLLMAVAGHYLTSGFLNSWSVQSASIHLELVSNLELNEFNDMPNEQVEIVYNNLIGG